MRIGCLMVTENRAPIAGIGIASAFSQDMPPGLEMVLSLQINRSIEAEHPRIERYFDLFRRFAQHGVSMQQSLILSPVDFPPGIASVPARTDAGCSTLFDHYACDVVALFDDDDVAPVTRLEETAKLWREGAEYMGYTSGWFVNLRTFRAEHFDKPAPGLWGGSLAFTRAAWNHRPFTGLPSPGYDGAFVDALGKVFKKGVLTRGEPVAFSHGRNVATWLMSPGIDGTSMIDNLPPLVVEEVRRAQKFLIDRRVFPPQVPE